MSRSSRNPVCGFSLAELLVIIGIAAVLIALLAPALVRSRQQAVAIKCRAQLQQIGQALANYAVSNNGHVPQYLTRAHPARMRYWPELLFADPFPRSVICPTAEAGSERVSYLMNGWILAFHIKLSDKVENRTSSEVVLMGENKPGSEMLQSSLQQEFPNVVYDRFRHGHSLRSNYLWFDLHVSNDEPRPRPGERDPWRALPLQ